MAIGESGLAFLQKEATIDDKGVAHVTQAKYLDFMGQNGVTKEMISAQSSAHEELVNGMYMFNAELMTKAIDDAKKDNTDPSRAKVKTAINIPKGSIVMTSTGAKTYPIPGQPDKRVTKVMVNVLDVNQTRLMDKALCSATEDEIRKQLGL